MNGSILKRLGLMLCLFCFVVGSNIPALGLPIQANSKNKSKIESLIEIAILERRKQQAIELADQAIYLADSLGESFLSAKANQISGIAWRSAGDFLMAYERLQKAFYIYNELELHHEANIIKREIGETFRAGGAFVDFSIKLNREASHCL